MAASFPPNPQKGEVYTYNGRTWKWDGYSWVATSVPSPTNAPAYVSMSPPPNPVSGSLWYNIAGNSLNVYCVDLNGSEWVAVVPYPMDSITQQGGVFEGAIYSQYEVPNNPSAFVTVGWVDTLVGPFISQVNTQQIQLDSQQVQLDALQIQLDALQTAFDDYVATHP